MKTVITNRKFETSEKLKEIIERKISRLDRFFPVEETANITLSTHGKLARVEITIFYKGTIFRAERENQDVVIALYDSVDTIERQIRKNKTRLSRKLRENAFESAPDSEPLDDLNDDVLGITKVKRFVLTDMTPEDAALQMKLLGHGFYMFRDVSNGKICVVYSRENGEYGLIVPEDE
ncbi:MAG: ribosome-associated translation inhibitor RaiA [Clostridia bacterium]|nr:ribosome-associated translation inhibitor RaiA [Clostridia bacterium]